VAEIVVLVAPYELGRLRDGVGRGPEHLLAAGAEDVLAANGAHVRRELIEIDDRFTHTGLGDEDAGFELIRRVADGVRAVRADGAFPVLLTGSCFAGVGVVAGLDEPSPGVVWLDAHGDFNEPSTAHYGYFDGMGLSVMTGGAWRALLATVPGARPVAETAVVLAGAHVPDDPPEAVRIEASQIVHLLPERLRSPEQLVQAVEGLTPAISGLYVHVDLDVLDSTIAPVNVYAEPGGLDGDQLVAAVTALLDRFAVRAISLASYDPGYDAEDRVPAIALRLLRAVADRV
jgi:arginase